MKRSWFILPALALAACSVRVQATVNYPFPQNSSYDGHGITLSDKSSAATKLKSAFSYYLSTFYNESGSYAGIRSNEGSNEYFSEGIGYGMLMMVYFSDATTSYQSQFDKLWAFYKASEDSKGLMNWKMGNLSPTTIWGENAATDGDVDVAAALILASYQFGDTKYLTEAQTLIANIRKYEFETGGLHKPGDSWNSKRNPSYISPAYYELFAKVDTDNATFWSTTAMNANYALLSTNSAEYSNGLFDNWTSDAGTGLDGYYGYDAARAPWRLAVAYYWYGHSTATTLLDKLGTWVNSQTPTSVKGSITRSSGSFGSDYNSTFVATLMTSLVTSSSHQTKLDAFWSAAVGLGNENYFNQSMKILSGLAVSGNMPNLSSMSTSSISGKTAANGVMVRHLADRVLIHLGQAGGKAELLDVSGRLARSVRSDDREISLSLTGLHRGAYLVRVTSGGRDLARRVITVE